MIRIVLGVVVIIVASVTAAHGQGDVVAGLKPGATDAERFEFWRYVATQSGLLVALLVLGWSYRRDLKSQSKDKDAEIVARDKEIEERKRELEHASTVIERNTEAITNAAVAMARQTDATHRLSKTVDSLERKIDG